MIPSGDKVGRKRAMLAGIAVILPSMFLGGFVGRYSPYILLRFATCTAIVFCWVSAHNLVVGCRIFLMMPTLPTKSTHGFQMEWFSRSHRRLAYVVSQVVGHGTGIVFPIIVYFNRDDVHGNRFI